MIDLRQDMHMHSTFSDGAHTPAQNLRQAERMGLHTICFTDHVRANTDWIAEYVSTIEWLRRRTSVRLYAGVEAKILDREGNLDLPDHLDGIDRILAADHQVPFRSGHASPRTINQMIAARETSAYEVLCGLLQAYERTMERYPGVVLAHPFSVLPKIGMSENDITDTALQRLARVARMTGARLEVSERWKCPTARVVSVFARAGAEIVASTDSHSRETIGAYAWVADLKADVLRKSAA